MKSDKYWNGRFEQLKKSQLKRTDSFLDDMHDLNKRMKKDISDDVTLWYQRVATANGISMADAKKLMSKKDREEFQWTLEQYEQEAKASLLTGGFSNKVINASANWHLNYLESIDLQLEHHADKMFKGVHDKTTDFLKDSIKESYTETAFELQKGMGKGFTMEVPYDEHKLENILRSPWASDGKNFSSRIWKRKDKLVNELKTNLSESVIRGDSDTEAIKALSIDADKAEFNTRRIIETESAFFDSESERQCCEDFGIEKYRFLAVLDLKTSDICQELDNKVFLEKERQIGVNAPPMHPFCRSTTAPVVDEEFLTSRRAKNPKTGEYDEIPPDMNYKEWKEKYVEGKENVEEEKEPVKAESSTGTGSSGAEIKIESQKVEGGAKDTSIPQREEKFDSKAYEDKIQKRANKQAINVQEPATIELDNPVSYGNTEKVYGVLELSNVKNEDSFIEFLKTVDNQKENFNINYFTDNLNKDKNLLEKSINFLSNLIQNLQKKIIKNNLIYGNIGDIRHVLLGKTSLKFAKDLEYCLKNINLEFPQIFSCIRAVGDLDVLIDTLADEDVKYDIEDFIEKNKSNPSQNWIKTQKEYRKQKNIDYLGIKDNINSIRGIYLKEYKTEKFYGIYVSTKIVEADENSNSSTDQLAKGEYTIKGTINHEIGHIIDRLLDISFDKNIIDYFNFHKKKNYGEKDFISENAKNSISEFVAEVISEGLTNHDVEILFNENKLKDSNIKDIIKKVFKIIIEKKNEKYPPKNKL